MLKIQKIIDTLPPENADEGILLTKGDEGKFVRKQWSEHSAGSTKLYEVRCGGSGVALAGSKVPDDGGINQYIELSIRKEGTGNPVFSLVKGESKVLELSLASGLRLFQTPNHVSEVVNKGYVDTAIAAITAGSVGGQKWLPAVDTKVELPGTVPDAGTDYLCRVMSDPVPADNGVYQRIAGSAEWTFFSRNLDFIDVLELAAALAAHNDDGDAHTSIRAKIADERDERTDAISGLETALYNGLAAEANARTAAISAAVAGIFSDVTVIPLE